MLKALTWETHYPDMKWSSLAMKECPTKGQNPSEERCFGERKTCGVSSPWVCSVPRLPSMSMMTSLACFHRLIHLAVKHRRVVKSTSFYSGLFYVKENSPTEVNAQNISKTWKFPSPPWGVNTPISDYDYYWLVLLPILSYTLFFKW